MMYVKLIFSSLFILLELSLLSQQSTIDTELKKIFFNLPIKSDIKEIIAEINKDTNFCITNSDYLLEGINGSDYYIGKFTNNDEIEFEGYNNSIAILHQDRIFNLKNRTMLKNVLVLSISYYYEQNDYDKYIKQLKSILKKFKKLSKKTKKRNFENEISMSTRYHFFRNDELPYLEIKKETSRINAKNTVYTLNLTYFNF